MTAAEEFADAIKPLAMKCTEDGVRLGIGMCAQLIDEVLGRNPNMSQQQKDALTGVRDGMREMSAEFTL